MSPPHQIRSFLLLTLSIHLSSTNTQYHNNNSQPQQNLTELPTDYACRPIGPCEPCPLEELSESVCRIFHNRRMVHCLYLGSSSPALVASILREPGTYSAGLMRRRRIEYDERRSEQDHDQKDEAEQKIEKGGSDLDDDQLHQAGVGKGSGGAEFPTWEACERVVSKERADFYEFVVCNLILTIVSLLVYTLRTRILINRQYGKLAARIGLSPN